MAKPKRESGNNAPKNKMSPPPAGAHVGDHNKYGFGMGLLVGALLGLFVGAGVLLFFEIERQDVLESVKSSLENQSDLTKPVSQEVNPRIFSNDGINSGADQDRTQIPAVSSTSPLDGAIDVPADAEVSISFDTDMDESTLGAGTISVFSTNDLKDIAKDLRFVYHVASKQLTLEFDKLGDDYGSANVVEITLSTGVKSQSGVSLSRSYRLKFKTK